MLLAGHGLCREHVSNCLLDLCFVRDVTIIIFILLGHAILQRHLIGVLHPYLQNLVCTVSSGNSSFLSYSHESWFKRNRGKRG